MSWSCTNATSIETKTNTTVFGNRSSFSVLRVCVSFIRENKTFDNSYIKISCKFCRTAQTSNGSSNDLFILIALSLANLPTAMQRKKKHSWNLANTLNFFSSSWFNIVYSIWCVFFTLIQNRAKYFMIGRGQRNYF